MQVNFMIRTILGKAITKLDKLEPKYIFLIWIIKVPFEALEFTRYASKMKKKNGCDHELWNFSFENRGAMKQNCMKCVHEKWQKRYLCRARRECAVREHSY